MKKQFISAAELLLTAMIWGVAFVAQSVSMNYIEPMTFTCSRSILGGLVLIPVIIFVLKGKKRKNGTAKEIKQSSSNQPLLKEQETQIRNSIAGGIVCGIFLYLASTFQQYGILYTSVGKAGFLTALYIVLVPVFGIFLKKQVHFKIWCSCFLSIIGFYFLCLSEKFVLSKGDFLVFLSAILFSFHILAIDHFSPKGEPILLSCIQFFICALISGIFMFVFESPSLAQIKAAAIPILYAGILSSGVAYTLQIVAQKNINPTLATLLMSLESVFSVLAGWLFLNQSLSRREILGCILIFTAVLLAQLPHHLKKTPEKGKFNSPIN